MPTKNVYKKAVTITSTLANPVPLELLADQIKQVSNAIKKIDASPVKRRVILLLINDITGISVTTISAMLDAMEGLSKRFLK